jgi:hypothetical protein
MCQLLNTASFCENIPCDTETPGCFCQDNLHFEFSSMICISARRAAPPELRVDAAAGRHTGALPHRLATTTVAAATAITCNKQREYS